MAANPILYFVPYTIYNILYIYITIAANMLKTDYYNSNVHA